MNIQTINGVSFDGVVACLPETLVDNRQACAELYNADEVDTLIKATGFKSRYIANSGTTALDMGVAAAKLILEKTNTAPEEIGAIICVTFTPEYLMPSDAPSAQSRLGLPNNIIAFDINMACSGYGYGLYIAATLSKNLQKKVLLLDGDVQTAYVSPQDKATVPIMADAGSATLVSPCDSTKDEWKFGFYSDGSRRNSLFIPSGGSKNPISSNDLEFITADDGSKRRNIDIFMDGLEVYKFVAIDVSKFILNFIHSINIDITSIDAFVPHQANMYMISQLAKKIKLRDKMWKSGDVYGNSASASVPVTIAKNATGRNRILLAGFGGGLSCSVALLDLSVNGVYEIIQYEKE